MSYRIKGPQPSSTGTRVAGAARWLSRHKTLTVGAAIVALVTAGAVLAPFIAPMDPTAQDLSQRLEPPSFLGQGDSRYPLGSDGFGRDILSRILYGARVSLGVVAASIAISGFSGTLLGLIAGYYEGGLGTIIMRIADMQLALPSILLAVTVVGIFGASLPNLIIVLAISGWVVYARVMYGQVRSLKQMDYVLAARALGASNARILRKHVLPNAVGAIVVIATLQVGRLVLLEAALSFLGLGVPPPAPSLGSMLSEGRNLLAVAGWLATFPGLAIVVTVLGINLLGNGLREVLDPKLRVG